MKLMSEKKSFKIEGLADRIDQIAIDFYDGNSVQMGKSLGFHDTSVRHYRSGKNEPKIDFFLALNKIIGISFDWLIYGKGEMLDVDNKNPPPEKFSEPPAIYRSFLSDDFDMLESLVARMRKRFEELSVPGQERDKNED